MPEESNPRSQDPEEADESTRLLPPSPEEADPSAAISRFYTKRNFFFFLLSLLIFFTLLTYIYIIPTQITAITTQIETNPQSGPAKLSLSGLQIDSLLESTVEFHVEGNLSQQIAPVPITVRPLRIRTHQLLADCSADLLPATPEPYWVPFSWISGMRNGGDSTSDPESTEWTKVDDELFATRAKSFPPAFFNTSGLFSVALSQVRFPVVVGAAEPLYMRGRVGILNVNEASRFVDWIVQSKWGDQIGPECALIWGQAEPRSDVDWIGSWRIPLWKYIQIRPNNITIDTKPFNFTLVETTYKVKPNPPNRPTINFALNYTFLNPFPISILPQSISVTAKIYYEKTQIFNTVVPHTSLNLKHGTNTNVTVSGISVSGGILKLFKFIELLAEGEELPIQIKGLKLVYENKRERVRWIEDMIRDWSLTLYVKAPVEETKKLTIEDRLRKITFKFGRLGRDTN
ncbi:hypothetical protein HK096_002437 [Nowakowskiella sp. JEL0078]|nr:hypothetical protein HK096_002437 [Nowakowskiella sp. JEL0078]